MWSLYTVFLGLPVLFLLPQDVVASCKIKTEPIAPLVVTQFGSKLLLSDSPQMYEREIGETIDLFCGSGFHFTRYRYSGFIEEGNSFSINNVKVQMKCGYNGFYHPQVDGSPYLGVKCLKGMSQMFESRTSLQSCEGYMTLVLGHRFDSETLMKSAAVCYDIAASQMKYVGYTTFPAKNRVLAKTQLGQLNDIRLDINVTYAKNLFRTVSQAEINDYMTKEKQFAQLFVEETFQSASLVQDEAVARQLAGYEDMMTTIWLRTMRSGNWRNWITAMHNASGPGVHFDIRLGVSGALKLPLSLGRPCNGSRSLDIELADGGTFPIPTHIWAHVHALEKTGGVQDDFVFVGHNSPFFRSDNSSDLCLSMCDQVSWLSGSLFASLHEFPAYGLVQCCRVEDVAHKLDNFPGPFESSGSTTPAPPLLSLLGSIDPGTQDP